MKKMVFAITMALLFVAALSSCKKNKAATEASLVVETTPANKSVNLNILGPDFPLKVEITSVLPTSGVKIEIAAAPESTPTASFYTASNNSTAPQNNYSITNTPSGVTCVVTITVTSLSSPTNKWTGTYRYSRK